MEKVNYPEISFIYINQVYLTIQKGKKMYYGNHFLIGQIIEASNSTENIDSCICKENEINFYRPKYNISNGEFLGLYETIEFIVVRGDRDKIFFNYGFDKENPKVLYSYYKRSIPNSFSGTLFNRRKEMIESGVLESQSGHSELFYFLSSITDCSEEVNKYLYKISLSPINLRQKDLGQWLKPAQKFELQLLDLCREKNINVTVCC